MNCILRPRGLTLGFENGFPSDFPEVNSSMPESKAFNWAIALVEPDRSNMYVVISGDGSVGKTSSASIDFTAPEIEPHPVKTNESKTSVITDVKLFFRVVGDMGISMYAHADKWGYPHFEVVLRWGYA